MGKYKVGDKVRVKNNLEYGDNEHGFINREMVSLAGKIITVEERKTLYDFSAKGWGWHESWVEPIKPSFELKPTESIMFTQQENTITAQLIRGEHVSKEAKAKCNPIDTFDFQVGAKLAFERLMKPDFKPCLMNKFDGVILGEIGQATSFVDIQGTKLHIGDTVSLYSEFEYQAELPIVSKDNNVFVMGTQGVKFTKPKISDNLLIIKKRSYTEVKHGETVNGITYIKEEA